MSESPPKPPQKAIPLAFWLVIVTLMGLAIGMWSPWKKGYRHTPDAPETLVHRLQDPDHAKRDTARLQLVTLGERAGPALLAAAQDEAFKARPDAIELLGRVRYQPALEFLVGLKDPAFARARLTALGNLGGPAALGELRSALQGKDVELQFVALRKLRDWQDPLDRAGRDEILPFLTSEHFGMRVDAARFFGQQRDAQAVTPLIACLQDEHGDVRLAAAWALNQIGDEKGIEAVHKAYASGAIPEEP